MGSRRRLAGGSVRGRRLAVVASATAIGLAATGCGSSDFENKPRSPEPYETSAAINDKAVDVSPAKFGAGPTVFTVQNFTGKPASLVLKPSSGRRANFTTQPIPAGGVATFKTDLAQGDWQALARGVSGVHPARIKVGPERPSAQNKLLLP